MTVFAPKQKTRLVDRIPDNAVRGLTIAVTLILTFVLSVPLSHAIAPVEGDYGRTVTVDYGNGVIIDAPASDLPVLRWGIAASMHSFVNGNDPSVRQLASQIAHGSTGVQVLGSVAEWIHDNIDYESDPQGFITDERWQMPGETLRLGTGDCEDMAILGASVMSALGYRTALIFEEGHVLFGADVGDPHGERTVSHNGHEYVTAEATTGRVGVWCDPFLITDSKWNGQVILVLAILLIMEAVMLAVTFSPIGRDARMESHIWNEDCNTGLDRIPDGSVDLVMMDPPYLLETCGGGAFGSFNRLYHGELSPLSEGIDMILFEKIMSKTKAVNAYVWCNKAQIFDYIKWFLDHDCRWDILCWHKTNPTPICNNKYLSDTEYVIYGRAKGVPLYGTYETKRKWYVSPLNTSDKAQWDHPTIKPLNIVQTLIENSTLPGQTVLDPFMGSGTTAVACIRSGREYLGFEMDPKHYDTCIKRISGASVPKSLESWGVSE